MEMSNEKMEMREMRKKEQMRISQDFYCDRCSYRTTRKANFERHMSTPKHLRKVPLVETETTTLVADDNNKNTDTSLYRQPQMDKAEWSCCRCDKTYTSNSGFWKHSKKCVLSEEENKKDCGTDDHDPKEENDDNSVPQHIATATDIDSIIRAKKKSISNELILEILKDNQELKQLVVEHTKSMVEHTKTIAELTSVRNHITNQNNNINNGCNIISSNKTFNLHFFLNETCKDALNIGEFIDQAQLTVADLERTGREGYAQGISQAFVRELKKVDVSKRPIHCSDVKRETLYIKDNDVWEKEPEERPRLKRAIKQIEKKNFAMLPEYQKANPEYSDGDHRKYKDYCYILKNSMGVFDTAEETEAIYDKIARLVSNASAIEKV